MGTVKYTGPVASFHCPTEATIRSLKVHFSPKQLGEETPSPENVRPIEGWDGVEVYNWTSANASALSVPNEYKKVEYLQTPGGGTYIDSGITMSEDIVFEIEFQLTETTAGRYFMGEYSGTAFFLYTSGFNSVFQTAFGATWANTALRVDTNRHKFTYSFSDGNLIVKNGDDIILERAISSMSIQNILVAGTRVVASSFPAKTYSSKMIKNGVVIQNLIPCVRKFDNKPGMYDTVSQTFYTNAGTGDFLYGPEVNGYTEDYEFGVLGKNKFNWDVPVSESSPVASDPSTAREFTLDTYVIGMSVANYYRRNYANWVLNPSVEDGVISFSSGGASGYGIAFPLKLAAGQTYFLSGTGDGAVGATYYDENGELISYQNGRLNKTITVPENAATTLIGFYASTSNTDFTFSNIQLELGSSATAYEPYNPNHTVYGGWVDLISGEVVREVIKVTTNEIVSFHDITDRGNGVYEICLNLPIYARSERRTEAKCNCFVYGSTSTGIADRFDLTYILNQAARQVRISHFFEEAPTINVYKEYLQSIGFEVVYYVGQEKYSVNPITLKTLRGANNIWSNADYIEVEYDLHETQDILNRKNFIIANQPHIVTPAPSGLVSFSTDMTAPLKECKVHFSPVQEGTGDPSPDNVRPISGWTGFEVTRCGKNLCDAATGTEMVEKWPLQAGSSSREKSYPHFPTGQSFTLSCRWAKAWETSANRRLYFNGNKQAGSFIAPANDGPVSKSITNTPSTTDARCLWISHNNRGLTYDGSDGQEYAASLVDVQLEIGSAATEFEPYQGRTLAIDWTDEAGMVYGGYVDLVNGEVVAECSGIVFNGTQPIKYFKWQTKTNTSGVLYGSEVTPGIAIPPSQSHAPDYLLSDKLIAYGYNRVPTTDALCFGAYYNSQYGIIMRLPIDIVVDVSTINNYLANNPIKITYPLAEPVRHSIDPQTLKTLRGMNNVWSNANGDIKVSYWKH